MLLEAMLNELLAMELVGVLRYRRDGLVSRHLRRELERRFLGYAHAQQDFADRIADRIVALGGSPYVDPSDLAVRSEPRSGAAVIRDLVGDELLFVRTEIATLDDMVRYVESHDLPTALLLSRILAMHELHAQELAQLLI